MQAKMTLVRAVAGALGGLLMLSLMAVSIATASRADGGAPSPALWKLSDEDSEIYLFGTIHILNPELEWRTKSVNDAFSAADLVYFEAPADTSNPGKMQALVAKYGINPPGTTLSSLMSGQTRNRLARVARGFGMPPGWEANLEPLRPWLAGVTLAAIHIQATGGDPNAGVERILSAEAAQLGKPIAYLESDEQQLQMFASLSPAAELFFFEDGLRQMQEQPDLLEDLVDLWRVGNVAGLDALMVQSMAEQAELYDIIMVRRNRDWAEQIDALMDGSGTAFIAVGAAHLAGGQSVQAFLRERGHTAVRQ